MRYRSWGVGLAQYPLLFALVLAGCGGNPSTEPLPSYSNPNSTAPISNGKHSHCVQNCNSANGPVYTRAGVSLGPIISKTYLGDYSAANVAVIKNTLHADYIRTQWSYSLWKSQNGWATTDAALAPICNADMPIGIILPGPEESLETGDTFAEVGAGIKSFLTRYTQGDYNASPPRSACHFVYAEVGSEENIPKNGLTITAAQYNNFWDAVTPYVAPFLRTSVEGIIAAGTSGVNSNGDPSEPHDSGIQWTEKVSPIINNRRYYPDAYGVDPYGTMVDQQSNAISQIAAAAIYIPPGCSNCVAIQGPIDATAGVSVMDIGMNDCHFEPPSCPNGIQSGNHDMYDTLKNMAGTVPFVSLYEYDSNGHPISSYDLVVGSVQNNAHAQIFADVQQGIAYIHAHNGSPSQRWWQFVRRPSTQRD